MPMSPPRDRHGEFVLYGIIHTVQGRQANPTTRFRDHPAVHPQEGLHNFLHNQSSLLIRAHLLYRSDVIITTVPYHFKNSGLVLCALYKESAPPTTKARSSDPFLKDGSIAPIFHGLTIARLTVLRNTLRRMNLLSSGGSRSGSAILFAAWNDLNLIILLQIYGPVAPQTARLRRNCQAKPE